MSFTVCLQQRERKKRAKERSQTGMDSAAIFEVIIFEAGDISRMSFVRVIIT